jgi:hypothetical protein
MNVSTTLAALSADVEPVISWHQMAKTASVAAIGVAISSAVLITATARRLVSSACVAVATAFVPMEKIVSQHVHLAMVVVSTDAQTTVMAQCAVATTSMHCARIAALAQHHVL